MEQYTKAELWGKVLELQHELELEKQSREKLKKQLIINYERNKY
jgi:hypothetical protein